VNFAGVQSITIPEGDVKSIAIGGVTVWQKPNPLPYDAEVEYIESTGTQWIDTGVTAASGLITVDALLLTTGTEMYCGYFGKAASDAGSPFYKHRTMCYYERRSARFLFEDGTANNVLGSGTTFRLQLDRRAWKLVPRTSSGSVDSPFQLFSGPGTSKGHMRLYSFAIYDDTTLARDYIPVRVGQVGYLYDRANPTGGPSGNGLYGSATSTPLVAGPDNGTTSTTAMTITESTD